MWPSIIGATSQKTKGMVWYKFQGVEYSLWINGIIKNHKGRENIRIEENYTNTFISSISNDICEISLIE